MNYLLARKAHNDDLKMGTFLLLLYTPPCGGYVAICITCDITLYFYVQLEAWNIEQIRNKKGCLIGVQAVVFQCYLVLMYYLYIHANMLFLTELKRPKKPALDRVAH